MQPETMTGTDEDAASACWAGHYARGGSDKVWGGAVRGCTFVSTWGRRGGALQRGEKVLKTAEAALALFQKKAQEKASEGYQDIAFGDPVYGVPVLIETAGDGATAGTSVMAPAIVTTITPKPSVYATGHVLPLEEAELAHCLDSPHYGVSEKVNGERCVVAFDGVTLTAYNRKGQPVSTAPVSAHALVALGHPFVLDGERLTGVGAGSYVIFDLLEWDGADMRLAPYSRRIDVVRAALVARGLVGSAGPTLEGAGGGLALLTAESDPRAGRAVIDSVAARGGEGIVVRTLDAPYIEGDTRHVRKIKFLADLDAFVVRVNPGLATGSVTLGLVRPADGAVVEICNVRSGLVDADITALAALLAAGERPVLTVEYLPARTVGVRLVEPKVHLGGGLARTDKAWQECHTTQLGAAKDALCAAAKPMRMR